MIFRKELEDSYILLHIPHSSLNIPQNDRKHILLDDSALEKEKLIMTDRHLDELCKDIPVNMLISEISRLVVDMERYDDDSQEPMAKHGMGVVYTSTHDEKPLRTVTDEYRAELIQKYYKLYHDELKLMCNDILNRHGECLIIDLHSFSSKPIFCYDYSDTLPDICIGFNGESSPLANGAKRFFEEKGLTVKFNYPFSGAIIPTGLEGKIESVMIEINRKLYMDEETGVISDGFNSIKSHIKDFVDSLN
ncbi:MAG: N-formylglutamate amidohydrolase [Oscillospiraceae bacterium]|nr:N-formylglutamate amidohydrolase [Oscillospiraceae bacterium]